MREADAVRYRRRAIDKRFGPQSPFKLARETREEGIKQTRRDYGADIGSTPIVVLITTADTPRSDGTQILMTAAQVKKQD